MVRPKTALARMPHAREVVGQAPRYPPSGGDASAVSRTAHGRATRAATPAQPTVTEMLAAGRPLVNSPRAEVTKQGDQQRP